MTAALIRKEFLQHWWALLLIGLLSLLGIGWILLLTIIQGQAGSHLFALRLHATFLAFSALILGNRLVVAEYSASTQIFLESLPLPRLRIVLVKYFLGLVIILICAACGLAIAMAAGARTEVYTPRFVGILSARYLTFAAFAYSFFFGMGFLGRYRFAAYALMVAGISLLVRTRDIALHELAPIHLIGNTFPFEREIFPLDSLVITGGLTLGFFLLSLVLAGTREGSVSSLLGERMSYRDKISLTALIFGLIATFFVIDQHKIKEPYSMGGGVIAEDTRIAAVTVAPSTNRSRRLADRLGKDLDALADFLDLEALPPVFVVERPDLDPDQFERGFLDEAEGIILRTPYNDEEWRYADCVEQITGDAVDSASNGRAMKEDRFWIVDGFTLYWPHFRDDAKDPLDSDRHLLLRALYGTELIGGIQTPKDLHRWFAHQHLVGHQITAGIGWSMLRVLEQTAGRDAAQAFMRATLASDPPKNLITSLREIRHPINDVFRDSTGLEMEDFLVTWNAELDRWRENLADSVAAIPRLSGELIFEGEQGTTVQARYRFEPPPIASPETFKRPVLLYGETGPFQVGLPEIMLKRQPLSPRKLSEGYLVDTWGSGAGLTWTFAADSPELRCRLISGWKHTHLP